MKRMALPSLQISTMPELLPQGTLPLPPASPTQTTLVTAKYLSARKTHASRSSPVKVGRSSFLGCISFSTILSTKAETSDREGGYESIYKGFPSSPPVSIKMLNPDSIQGPAEFKQEDGKNYVLKKIMKQSVYIMIYTATSAAFIQVDVLSKLRHPDVVTLVRACSEEVMQDPRVAADVFTYEAAGFTCEVIQDPQVANRLSSGVLGLADIYSLFNLSYTLKKKIKGQFSEIPIKETPKTFLSIHAFHSLTQSFPELERPMSWRGRGRGRGYGGRFHPGRVPQNQKPFILYPDDNIVLPELPDILFEKDIKKQELVQQKFLVSKDVKLTEFWKNSPYYLQENSGDIAIEKAFQNERFSDRFRLKSSNKRPLSDYLELKKGNFPRDLLVGMKRRGQKKVKWDFKREDRMFKDWEKSEANRGDFEENDSEDEEEEEEEEEKGEEGSEEEDDEYDSDGDKSPLSSDGDYGRGEGFDDDEDDFNPLLMMILVTRDLSINFPNF
ncbi:unnamed protein product [Dovyalis caffra]|uniref:Protein kinase domain-containing protein n=1 Tax=Dovyalis caffra TaxID=77055 RepID=A0AAV1SFA3_9ROSI|nr:unnamed protein product [Dovyalis caffra]